MKTVEIKCDGCGHDLTYTGNCVDYRLILASEAKSTYPDAGAVTCMGISPSISRAHHFCGVDCLDHWRDREHHSNKLSRDWWDEWKEKHGTKNADGHIYSYPCPPSDVIEASAEEFKAAALVVFPMQRLSC